MEEIKLDSQIHLLGYLMYPIVVILILYYNAIF